MSMTAHCAGCPQPGFCVAAGNCKNLYGNPRFERPPDYPQRMNPWHPMSDPVDLKTAGKALEELGECTAALSRCLIQGMDGVNPDGGKVNRQWLENEMDDVRAQLFLLTERFTLRSDANRVARKIQNCRDWHKMA